MRGLVDVVYPITGVFRAHESNWGAWTVGRVDADCLYLRIDEGPHQNAVTIPRLTATERIALARALLMEEPLGYGVWHADDVKEDEG